MRSLPLAGLLSLLLAGCAHGPVARGGAEGEVVEAEGWSPADAKNPMETRARALAEAQRKAVEGVVGVRLSARTRVEAAVSVEARIEANVGGWIERYEVLSEDTEGGFLRIKIRALVLLKAPPAPLARQSRRIAVVVPDEGLSRGIRAALAERGFPLSDGAKDADVVVTGSAQAYAVRADRRLTGFQGYRAQASLDVLIQRTGEMSHQSQEGSGLDPVAGIARDSAVENAGRAAGETLAARLTTDWTQEVR